MSDSPFRHEHSTHKPHHLGGDHYWFHFDNGYGASVVRFSLGSGSGSYGADAGKWELAVLGLDGDLDYTTPITDDVLGWLSEADVDRTLDQIAALPAPVATS